MKKGFIAGAALALALAAPVTVLADEKSPDTKEPRIFIVDMNGNDGAVIGDSVAAVINEKWGMDLDAEYTIVYVGDARVYANGEEVENYGPGLTLDVSAAEYGGDLVIHHKNNGKNDIDTTITLKSEDLSPVVVVKKVPMGGDDSGSDSGSGKTDGSGSGTANTGDSNNAGLWAGALIVSALLAGAAIVMNKRNA